MKTTIGICGYGVVGKALHHGFKPYYHMEIYDPPKGYKDLNNFMSKSDYIFISIPTPMKDIKGGEIDLCIMDDLISLLVKKGREDQFIIIKSTVIPGTMDRYAKMYPGINFVFNPEFLTEDNAIMDFMDQDRIVIASDKFFSSQMVGKIYKRVFPETPIIYSDFKEAEMSKYACNCLLAAKVSYANEIYRICQKQNIDYNEVKQIMLADRRIGKTHLDVPGKDDQVGWGHRCFPKDINALIHYARSIGYEPLLLECMWSENLKYRKYLDWKDIPGAVSENMNYYKEGE